MEITIVETALGHIGLIGDGMGLRSVTHFYPSGDACLSESGSGTDLVVGERFANLGAQLKRYADGERIEFTDGVYWWTGTEFERGVWLELSRIPWGQVIGYSDLARSIGNLKAVRAVGGAVGRNPWPVVVPCHRVVGVDGSLVGYGGGLGRKAELLEIEGHHLDTDRLRLLCCRPKSESLTLDLFPDESFSVSRH